MNLATQPHISKQSVNYLLTSGSAKSSDEISLLGYFDLVGTSLWSKM